MRALLVFGLLLTGCASVAPVSTPVPTTSPGTAHALPSSALNTTPRPIGTRAPVTPDAAGWPPEGFQYCQGSDTTIACKFLKSNEFTCDFGECKGMLVVPKNGCASSLYVEMNELANDVVIGTTNAAVGGVRPLQQARLIFHIFEEDTDTVRVNDVLCY